MQHVQPHTTAINMQQR